MQIDTMEGMLCQGSTKRIFQFYMEGLGRYIIRKLDF
jgi:hypothetical protein